MGRTTLKPTIWTSGGGLWPTTPKISTFRNPDYLTMLPETQRLNITNRLSYVRQYCEMPLKILKAEELVGGEEAMDQILRRLFCRDLDPTYPYLTYQDFLTACGLSEEALDLA